MSKFHLRLNVHYTFFIVWNKITSNFVMLCMFFKFPMLFINIKLFVYDFIRYGTRPTLLVTQKS